MGYLILDSEGRKLFRSKNANYDFNKETGEMATWGKTLEEDAVAFPAPTILDLEVTTKCTGVGGVLCKFCYKSSNPNGENLSYENFRKIFNKLPKTITQIAFGADSKCITNPDIWDMMIYARDKGVIPNITVAEISDDVADKLASVCGAVAVSMYSNKNICFDGVKKLTDRGMSQVNIHAMISQETFQNTLEGLEAIATDPRLSKLNAIVFLSLKTKGRGEGFHPLTQEQFNQLIQVCKDKKIRYGFDSCSSLKYFQSLTEEEYKKYAEYVQPCESTLESSYINVRGEFYPCSFTEGTEGWEIGISVLDCEDFEKDIWNHPRVQEFRDRLLATSCNNKFNCRNCPIYRI